MNFFMILVGFASNADRPDSDRFDRVWALASVVFSLGPAWQGNQGSILLKTELSRDEVVAKVSPLVEHSDLVGVIEIAAKSMTMIGWNADEEGLDGLYPGVVKFGVSPAGGTYPLT